MYTHSVSYRFRPYSTTGFKKDAVCAILQIKELLLLIEKRNPRRGAASFLSHYLNGPLQYG